MWSLIRKFAGVGVLPQITRFVVVALVVILTSYGLIQYGKSIERHDIQIEQNENYIDTRGRIDDATKDNPDGNPATALDRLRRMYPIGE